MPDQEGSWTTFIAAVSSAAGAIGAGGVGAWIYKVWRTNRGDKSADHLGTIAEYRQLVKDQRVEIKEAKAQVDEFRSETRVREDEFRKEAVLRYETYRDDMQVREDAFRKQAEERFDLYRKESHARANAMQTEITSLYLANRVCERENAMLAQRVSHLEERFDGDDPKKTGDAIPTTTE